jgi:hypothetical protein
LGVTVARLGLLEALDNGCGPGRGRRAGAKLADMGLGPVGEQAGIDRAQRVGPGIGVGGRSKSGSAACSAT